VLSRPSLVRRSNLPARTDGSHSFCTVYMLSGICRASCAPSAFEKSGGKCRGITRGRQALEASHHVISSGPVTLGDISLRDPPDTISGGRRYSSQALHRKDRGGTSQPAPLSNTCTAHQLVRCATGAAPVQRQLRRPGGKPLRGAGPRGPPPSICEGMG
jgi:hypothetical protein